MEIRGDNKMETKFSEVQFAYSVTREIEDKILFSSLDLGRPHIPNQRQEAVGGYDVAFHGTSLISIFLQYKLPIKLTRSNATEWAEFNQDYFRIKIYPDSDSHQHNILCDIARRDRRNQVFYCAPAFTEDAELSEHHSRREVANHSVFINCYDLPFINGSENHNICYTMNPVTRTTMHSKSYFIKANHGWKWTDSCNEKYSNLHEFVSNVSEEYHINVTGESEESDLKTISNHFVEKGLHMLLLNG